MVKASDLVKQQKEKDKSKDKIYKKIYERIEYKIKHASGVNLYECWYEIPEFILNIPLYNLENCKLYVVNKLVEDGFNTSIINNYIWISWKV
jgi:hypothetical protein